MAPALPFFFIDRGGTFTDALMLDPRSGAVSVAKLISSDRAPLQAIRQLLAIGPGEPIPPCHLRMGTTLATNALLERKGARVGLVVSRGFRDLLEIGTQARPQIFELEIVKPALLYQEVLEVDARASPSGEILARPEPRALEEGLASLWARGLRSLAVVVLHAYRAPELEQEIARVARGVGFERISLSSEVARELGMLARGDTAAVDAYLTPLIADYLAALSAELPGSSLSIMQSSGSLVQAEHFRGKNAILSGPAGGALAAARVAEAEGLLPAIGFDMGGTSTDVSRYAGELEREYETEVAGVRLRAPMMAVHTVAAGGGSICRYQGGRFTVGPESAGAVPGPLCYGHPAATELTVTDVNLILGRVRGDRFPFPLEHRRAQRALEAVAAALAAEGRSMSALQVAEGFFEVANANMAEALRQVSIRKGYDVRDHTLVVFGGAGGQHACALARRLGIRTVLFHPLAGVLSAYGMALADLGWHGEIDAGRALLTADLEARMEPLWAELEARGRAALAAEPRVAERVVVRRVDLRYAGTEAALSLVARPGGELRADFEARHQRQYGYLRPDHPIEAVTARVEVLAPGGLRLAAAAAEERPAPPLAHADWWCGGRLLPEVPLWDRRHLASGTVIEGPAIVLEDTATIALEPGFRLRAAPSGALIAEQLQATAAVTEAEEELRRPDPVRLEIYNHLYMSIAEQMGAVLRKTALSTNIRERLDFSCAVFDQHGGLVANAPHIPVHLGAMSESIRAVLAAHPRVEPGEVYVTNDPSAGGSHLPDITVVSPVHDAQGSLRFFTANRGHHADVGGITPGSMPAFSRSLAEEGVAFRALRMVHDGRLDEAALTAVLSGGPHPARAPAQNLADLQAQLAANAHGARLLEEMISTHGLGRVRAYMAHVQTNAAERVRAALRRLPRGERRFADALDDGTPIVVRVRVGEAKLEIDFSGSGKESAGNLNAPRAVTVAAVLYVLRALVGEPIPLNGGCLRPVELTIPTGSILSPGPGRAVAGGNVETSQRVVDVLLAALGLAAASQGTMNNLSFGDARFGYYETIAGGAGATARAPGASAVHTHMTNTRITDPEVLEARFPVRLLDFSIRRGSGGAGRHRGGDGLRRELLLLAPLSVSILSERRARQPFGLEGGAPGARGRNLWNGRELPGKASFEAAAGDRVCIETPGGGGYGAP